MSGTEKSQSTPGDAETRRLTADVDGASAAATEYRAVRFYESEQSLARIVAEFLADGFDRGSPGIVIATASQRAAIVQELTDRSLDVVALQRSQDLVLLDAEETLSTFIVDSHPNAQQFRDQMCRIVDTVTRGRTTCTVRLFGQLVDILWQQGQRDAAIRLELLWNQLAQEEAASLVCGYAIGNFFKGARVEDGNSSQPHFGSADGTAERVVSTASDTHRRGRKREGRR